MIHIFLELLLAFTCSIGFGIVFGIRPKHLPMAGLAGFLVKVVVMLTQLFTANRFIYTLLGASMAALFSEIVGRDCDTTHSKYLYPALVPLIPGDLLYQVLLNLLRLNESAAKSTSLELMGGLFGIALGCMIVPSLIQAWKIIRDGQN